MTVKSVISAIQAVIAVLFVAAHAYAEAPSSARLYRVGMLRAAAPPDSYIAAFRQGLRELGYAEGKNLILEYRWGENKIDRLPVLAAELVHLKVDVIVIDGMPAVLAAKGATRTVPIIMAGIGDPVAQGVVESFTRPGGNVTGLTIMAPELSGKRLALLKELIPRATRFAVLTNPDNQGHANTVKEMVAAARAMDVTLHVVEARGAEELDSAFSSMVGQGAAAFTVAPDQVLSNQRARILRLAAQNQLPGLYERKETVMDGGLMSYGVNYQDMYRRAAFYVDRVVNGAKAGDIPIEQPTKFELVINKATARILRVNIPESLLLRADIILE